MGIIGTIRKHSWVAVTIVGVAIVAFIIGDLTKNRGGIPDLGKVNGTTMTAQRFNQKVEELEANYKRQNGTEQISSDVEYQLREQVWQNFLEETLMEKELNALGMMVTPREVSDMYVGTFIHPYLRQNFTDPQTGAYNTQVIKYYTENFDQLDTNAKAQWLELEKAVKADRRSQKYNSLIAKSFYMPKAIAQQVADLSSTSADVRVAMMSYQSMPNEEANPTEDDFKKYYNEHKAEYRLREELRNLDFVIFPVNPTQADMAEIQTEINELWNEFQTTEENEMGFFISAARSTTPYDSAFVKASSLPAPFDSLVASAAAGSNIEPRIVGNEWKMARVLKSEVRPDSLRASSIWILTSKAGGNITRSEEQAKALADSVLALVKGGKMTFEEAVAQFSDDPQKADNKGDMNWALDGGYGFLNEEIVNTPVGGIFSYEHPQKVGYYIVKVTDKTPASKKFRVAMLTREIVPSEKTEQEVYNIANQFAGQNRTYQEMISAAQQQNLPVRNAMVQMMSNTMAGIPNARTIVQWAFNKETESGMVADQVFQGENMYIVVAVKEILKKGIPELAQIHDMIENQVRIEKKAEIMMAKAEEAMKSTKNINALAAKLGTTVDSVSNANFSDYYFDKFGMEPKVLATIAIKDKGLVGPVKGANGVYMLQIDNKTKAQKAVDVESIRYNMEAESQQKVRSISYSLRDKAKIIDQRNKLY